MRSPVPVSQSPCAVSTRCTLAARALRASARLLFGLVLLMPHYARADLMLYPTRIVFEKNQRAAQVEIINNGTEPATYRISLVNRRMNETGDFSTIDAPAPGELLADSLVRYSPRQVTLAPGVAQVVRIILRKPADLAPGEYRSHLQFDRQPDPKGGNSIETRGPRATSEIGITITTLIGASIPVIVRHGDTAATASLSHLELRKPAAGQSAALALQIDRSGNRSVFGDLAVGFTPQGGSEQIVAKAGGIAVYSSNPLRRTALPLQPPSGGALAHGTLHVTYRERPEAGGNLLAEATLALP